MYISNVKTRKLVIRLSILITIISISVTTGYYLSYNPLQFQHSGVDIPYVEIKLVVSLVISIALLIFTYRTIKEN